MREADIQNSIRLHISSKKLATIFRANVGEAWTGDVVRNHDGSITIYNPRRFNTGLPQGFSDLFGVCPSGQAVFIEVKAEKGRPTKEQVNFLEVMRSQGALTGIARSADDAENIIRGRGSIK